MKTIKNYPFSPADRFIVKLPLEAEIIHVDRAGMRAIVDTDRPEADRVFYVAPEGGPLNPGAVVHVGSYADGDRTVHVFSAE